MNPSDDLYDMAVSATAALTSAKQITDELAHLHRQLVEWSIPTPDVELAELWSVVAIKRCRR